MATESADWNDGSYIEIWQCCWCPAIPHWRWWVDSSRGTANSVWTWAWTWSHRCELLNEEGGVIIWSDIQMEFWWRVSDDGATPADSGVISFLFHWLSMVADSQTRRERNQSGWKFECKEGEVEGRRERRRERWGGEWWSKKMSFLTHP